MPSEKPARRKPRQVRAELTRDRILNAAAHIFTEYGYAAGTTNRIAERARVSIGSLYQYFPNKDAILAELVLNHIDEGGADTPITDSPDRDLETVLRLFVRKTIDNHRADPRLLRLMLEEAPLSPDLLTKIIRYSHKRIAQLKHVLATHPEVRVTDLDMAARLIENTVELVTHKLMAESVEAQRLENELVAMLSRYLRG
ncbi:TetR/AcrR family transcriptional regulator [Actinoplanes sp. TFC3]|uniref:TetR/AcrR family transcriptional regulator n=1 Tax=Actinoplanes sp. TFC3 TaxID=1710355 RepID=UPI000830B4C5|nr:TetR/AcrR family transcriptional regulator [Actinoplanes sp. TFC3]